MCSVQSIRIEALAISQRDSFRYLGSIISKDGEIDEGVKYRIKAGWLKWRLSSGVLCDRRIPTRLKGDFYRTMIRPIMTYGAECLPIKKQYMHKMDVAQIRMMMWMCGKTRRKKIRSERFREHYGVASIWVKIRETHLRWFGHVQYRLATAPVRKSLAMIVYQRERSGRRGREWS